PKSRMRTALNGSFMREYATEPWKNFAEILRLAHRERPFTMDRLIARSSLDEARRMAGGAVHRSKRRLLMSASGQGGAGRLASLVQLVCSSLFATDLCW